MSIDYRQQFEKEKEVRLQTIARHNFTQTAINYFEWLEIQLTERDELIKKMKSNLQHKNNCCMFIPCNPKCGGYSECADLETFTDKCTCNRDALLDHIEKEIK